MNCKWLYSQRKCDNNYSGGVLLQKHSLSVAFGCVRARIGYIYSV